MLGFKRSSDAVERTSQNVGCEIETAAEKRTKAPLSEALQVQYWGVGIEGNIRMTEIVA